MQSHTKFLASITLALAFSACGTPDFGHRTEVVDADQRLDALLEAWRESRESGRQPGGSAHIVVDAQRARNEIQRLALEHPSHARTLMANAALAYDARETEKAVDYLDRIFHLHTAHAEAAVLRARIAVEQGNLPYAKRLLAQQFEIRAGQSLFWFRPWSRREGGILRIIVGIRPTEGRFPAIVHPVVGQVGVEGF